MLLVVPLGHGGTRVGSEAQVTTETVLSTTIPLSVCDQL